MESCYNQKRKEEKVSGNRSETVWIKSRFKELHRSARFREAGKIERSMLVGVECGRNDEVGRLDRLKTHFREDFRSSHEGALQRKQATGTSTKQST